MSSDSSLTSTAGPDLHRLLHEQFGFREFLEGQEPVVQAILDGRDVLVIMPTGGGKSLCYQLPALNLQGITVVVSPLIALMKDQVDSLVGKNIAATFINSSITQAETDERIRRMTRGEFRLTYVAPERFKSQAFLRALAPLSIGLFAVDEAHCISQWGHDFRPDYLRLRRVLEELGRPQVAALTATATPEVRQDIIDQLALGRHGRRAPEVFISGFARHNLTITVTPASNEEEKLTRIIQTVKELKTGIVYCATRKKVERVALELSEQGIEVVAYHGGMADARRAKAQAQFMNRQCDVVVATNAFGMGIDRADLRFVMHHDVPGSVEAYYQEIGRAGRDGEPARCELLFNYADVQTQEFFIEASNPTRDMIVAVYDELLRLCARGSIEKPISEIARGVPEVSSEMAAGSALHLLERAGFIERDYRTGSRTYTTRLVEPIKALEQLAIDFEQLETKRERDFAKLRQLLSYVDTQGCRHHFILGYFGDPEASEHCNVCDNCLARASFEARLPGEEETVIIQKALSCVARLNHRFGRGRITQVLVGSRAKEVLEAGLDRTSTYGLLADLGTDYVWSLLNALIDAGCIAASGGQYPTISLTPLGAQVMRRKNAVRLVLPPRQIAKARKSARSRSVRSAGSDAGEPENKELFEALRKWRRDKADSLGNLPPYLVYPDQTLRELCGSMPLTEAELLEVRGIGPAKARQFGAETLAVIKKFKEP